MFCHEFRNGVSNVIADNRDQLAKYSKCRALVSDLRLLAFAALYVNCMFNVHHVLVVGPPSKLYDSNLVEMKSLKPLKSVNEFYC